MKRVLVVDDDPGTVELVRSVLEVNGHGCLTAADGAEALETVRHVPGILLVISDINMPGLDGISLLERMSAIDGLQAPRVIFITAYPSVDYAVAALRLGAIDFLTKPMRAQDLLARVENAIARIERQSAASHLPEQAAALAQQAEMLATTLKKLVHDPSGNLRRAPEVPRAYPDHHPRPAGAREMALFGLDSLHRLRREFPPLSELDDVGWDLVRKLMRAEQDAQRLSVSALSASVEEASSTTALRRIQELARAGHIIRSPDPTDARRDFVALGPEMRATLERYLERIAQELASVAGSR